MTINTIFCGSPDFACPALDMLNKHPKISLQAVFSQPDKIRSRGKKSSPTAVRSLALDLEIPTETPESKAEFAARIHHYKPDLIIVIAYGMIIPNDIVDNYHIVNCHGSLLPAYRGASPIQTALLNGDEKTGITLMEISEQMDSGNIISTKETIIEKDENFGSLYEKLSLLSSTILEEWLNGYEKNQEISSTPQNHHLATYCSKITKEQLLLDLSDGSRTNFNKIRAFSPKPGAYIISDNKRIKILSATIDDDILKPTLVQPEGKKPMSYDDYLKGYQKDIILC